MKGRDTMNDTGLDLEKAFADRDCYIVQCFVVEQQNLLTKDWMSKPNQDFYKTLRISEQKLHRAKRQLSTLNDEIIYQIGIWEGVLQIYRTLYVEKIKKDNILEAIADKSSETTKIIRFLHQYGKPVRHGELADTLEMDYSTLTTAMKKAIGCGAVSASGTGRNTRYVLTPAGKQYCTED